MWKTFKFIFYDKVLTAGKGQISFLPKPLVSTDPTIFCIDVQALSKKYLSAFSLQTSFAILIATFTSIYNNEKLNISFSLQKSKIIIKSNNIVSMAKTLN